MQRKVVNSGFLIGPFCPIYGYGAIIMYYCLIGLKNDIFLLFISSFVILSFWEYIVGWMLEIVFKTKYWDYSKKFANINGRVCLLNSCFWGILGVLFINVIHPLICVWISMIPFQLNALKFPAELASKSTGAGVLNISHRSLTLHANTVPRLTTL